MPRPPDKTGACLSIASIVGILNIVCTLIVSSVSIVHIVTMVSLVNMADIVSQICIVCIVGNLHIRAREGVVSHRGGRVLGREEDGWVKLEHPEVVCVFSGAWWSEVM